MGQAAQETDEFEALVKLSDKLKGTSREKLSLSDVIGIAEMLTSSLQPLLRRIDSTIQRELRGILTRIETLRTDIANVRAEDISNNHIPQMGKELSAIVEATEGATNSIMTAAEEVLAADSSADGYADVVSDKMMQIFEACSFQDITGQRVTKIVEAVELIEGRIGLLCNMLDLGDLGAADDEPLTGKQQRKKDLLLNGPADKGEGVDQAAIDKLF